MSYSPTNLDQLASASPLATIAKLVPGERTLTPSSAEYSNPSAGNFVWTVPNGKRWQFSSAYLILATGSTAANRLVQFGAGVNGGYVQLISCKATQAASLSRSYNLAQIPTDTAFDATGAIGLTVPPLMIRATGNFTVNISGFQSGDTLTPQLEILEWVV